MHSCAFNDVKRDKKMLLCITGLDFCKSESSGLASHHARIPVFMLFSSLMPLLSNRRCGDRLDHSSGQEGRIL